MHTNTLLVHHSLIVTLRTFFLPHHYSCSAPNVSGLTAPSSSLLCFLPVTFNFLLVEVIFIPQKYSSITSIKPYYPSTVHSGKLCLSRHRYTSPILIFQGPFPTQFMVSTLTWRHIHFWDDNTRCEVFISILFYEIVFFFLTTLQIYVVKEPSFLKFQEINHQYIEWISLLPFFSLFYCSWPNKSLVKVVGRNPFSKCLWRHPALTPVSALVPLQWMLFFYVFAWDRYLEREEGGDTKCSKIIPLLRICITHPVLMWINELSNGALKGCTQICHGFESVVALYLNTPSCQIRLHVGAYTHPVMRMLRSYLPFLLPLSECYVYNH